MQIEIGPRDRFNLVLFFPKENGKVLFDILEQNNRKHCVEYIGNLIKITFVCNIFQAGVIWKLIGHLSTEYKK